MNMNDAFVGSLIFNRNSGGGASAMSDLTDVAITSPSEGETLIYDSTSEKWVNGTGSAPALDDLTDVDTTTPSNGDTLVYDSTSSKWVNGQGGGKQTALTQAQYDALVQAGTVDPEMEYFITDGIPASVNFPVTVYTGTKTNNITDGECTITVADMNSYSIIQVSGFFKANGTLSTVTEYTDLFTFDAAAFTDLSTLSNTVMLSYGADSGFFFCRTCVHAANNAIACFYGTTADKWYSFHQIFVVEK